MKENKSKTIPEYDDKKAVDLALSKGLRKLKIRKKDIFEELNIRRID